MEEKKTNKKLIWTILFAVVSVAVCYLFIVAYFYYISPNNIAAKLTVWPFANEENTSKMYKEAVVDIRFSTYNQDTFEKDTVNVTGVNIREDGFVLAPYSKIKVSDNGEYKILTNSGAVYDGKLLFCQKDLNLAVFKCEKLTENQKIKIPYVKIAKSNPKIYSSVLAISCMSNAKDFWSGHVVEDGWIDCKKTVVDTHYCVDYVIEDCYTAYLKSNSQEMTDCALFDMKGNLLGFSFESTLEDGNYIVAPVYYSKLFINDVINAYFKGETYQNALVDAFGGLDKYEMECNFEVLNLNNEELRDKIYFDGSFTAVTSGMKYFNQQVDISGIFMLKNVSYKGQEPLEIGDVLSKISINGSIYNIETKVDLLEILYNLDEGDKVVLIYYDSLSNISSTTKQIKIVI